MLTAKLCELCPQLHKYTAETQYHYDSALWETFLECKYCHSWVRIMTKEPLTVRDLIRIDYNVVVK